MKIKGTGMPRSSSHQGFEFYPFPSSLFRREEANVSSTFTSKESRSQKEEGMLNIFKNSELKSYIESKTTEHLRSEHHCNVFCVIQKHLVGEFVTVPDEM